MLLNVLADFITVTTVGGNKLAYLGNLILLFYEGSQIRMTAVVAEVEEVRGGYQLAIDATIEIEGGEKPAVVARSLQRFYA